MSLTAGSGSAEVAGQAAVDMERVAVRVAAAAVRMEGFAERAVGGNEESAGQAVEETEEIDDRPAEETAEVAGQAVADGSAEAVDLTAEAPVVETGAGDVQFVGVDDTAEDVVRLNRGGAVHGLGRRRHLGWDSAGHLARWAHPRAQPISSVCLAQDQASW